MRYWTTPLCYSISLQRHTTFDTISFLLYIQHIQTDFAFLITELAGPTPKNSLISVFLSFSLRPYIDLSILTPVLPNFNSQSFIIDPVLVPCIKQLRIQLVCILPFNLTVFLINSVTINITFDDREDHVSMYLLEFMTTEKHLDVILNVG